MRSFFFLKFFSRYESNMAEKKEIKKRKKEREKRLMKGKENTDAMRMQSW